MYDSTRNISLKLLKFKDVVVALRNSTSSPVVDANVVVWYSLSKKLRLIIAERWLFFTLLIEAGCRKVFVLPAWIINWYFTSTNVRRETSVKLREKSFLDVQRLLLWGRGYAFLTLRKFVRTKCFINVLIQFWFFLANGLNPAVLVVRFDGPGEGSPERTVVGAWLTLREN